MAKIDEQTTARWITLIFNPVLTLGLFIIFGNLELIRSQPVQAIIFLVLGFSLPSAVYFNYLYKHKHHFLASVDPNRDSRQYIYLVAIISLSLVVLLFTYTNQDQIWVDNGMVLVIFFGALYLINKFIDKISIHAAAFSFGVIYLSGRVSMAFALLLFLLPFICWARVTLHKHTWFQLMLGIVVGMFLGILAWAF